MADGNVSTKHNLKLADNVLLSDGNISCTYNVMLNGGNVSSICNKMLVLSLETKLIYMYMTWGVEVGGRYPTHNRIIKY